jgi:glycosyltransferase involved in cell wall biosynthesis
VHILLVSNMYPGRRRPEFGVFVAGIAAELRDRGHQVDLAVIRDDRTGRLRTPLKYAFLAARALSLARRRPDVVYAHYLVPTGLVAAVAAAAGRAPLVVTAHGTDVANTRRSAFLAWLTRWVLRRSAAVIAVSDYLAGRLPDGAPRIEVIDCGVDTGFFQPSPRGEPGPPRYLYVGALIERKNPGRLLEAFARLEQGTLTVVGAGPLEDGLRAAAPAGVVFTGRLTPEGVREQLLAADVLVAPSLEEPQGQQVLEALASGRPVVATRVGGPAEVVGEDCGVLVDPLDVAAIADGMRAAAELPVPCQAAVQAASAHDRALQAGRIDALLAEVIDTP